MEISCPECHGKCWFGNVHMPETECRTCNAVGHITVADTRTPMQKLMERIRRSMARNDGITLDAAETKLIVKHFKNA